MKRENYLDENFDVKKCLLERERGSRAPTNNDALPHAKPFPLAHPCRQF